MVDNIEHTRIPSCLITPKPKPHIPDDNELNLRLLVGSCALLPRAKKIGRAHV